MVNSGSNAPGYFTSTYKASLSAGLYTQASSLNIPEGHSPAMENVFFNRRNNIRTRFGTQELIQSITNNTYIYVFRTKFDVTLIAAKEGLHLGIYRIREVQSQDIEVDLFTFFENVWSEEALNSKPDFLFISSDNPARVVIATGQNTPVQLRISERLIVSTAPTVTLTVQDSAEFAGVMADTVLFNNGVLVDPLLYSFVGSTVTLNAPMSGTFDLMYIGWNWYTEASAFFGFQLAQTVSRFNTGPSDLSLAIPLELLIGIRSVEDNPDRLPILPYKNGLRANILSYLNPPVAENDYTFSGGSFRTTANIQKVLPGVTHVTFGALNATATDISELTFVKGLSLVDYNGGVAMASSRYTAFVDDTESQFIVGVAPTNDYGSYFNGYQSNFVQAVNPTTPISYVMFAATNNVGLVYGSVVRVIRESPLPSSGTHKFIGSAAQGSVSELPYNSATAGTWWPIYGLQEHADFLNGSFPSLVELHENRLVFSGFPSNPNRVVLSAVTDTTIRGDYYSDFQIEDQEGVNANAVIIDINTADAGGITAVRSTSGVLFVFTLNSVYLVQGGEGGVTPTSKSVSQIAGVGAVNANCVVNVNNSLLFLSRSGIYALAQSFDAAGGWRVQLMSEPINDRVLNPANSDVSWMTFLPNQDTLYISVASEGSLIADELYLWKQDINSWSKFSDYTGFWKTVSGDFIDLSENYLLMVKEGRLVSYPFRLPIDQLTLEPDPVTVDAFLINRVQTLPFRTLPDIGINDIGAVGRLVFRKLTNTQILVSSVGPGEALAYPSGLRSDLVVVYTNDGIKRDIGYNVIGGFDNVVNPTDITGYIYKCYVTTASLFASSQNPASYLPSLKSVHTCYFVFHTGGEYMNFGVSIKKIDTEYQQITFLNTFTPGNPIPLVWILLNGLWSDIGIWVDDAVWIDDNESNVFDETTLEAIEVLLQPFWKIAIHPGGIEDFYQMIVASDSPEAWELVSLQTTVSQSSTRPGTSRV